MLHTGFKLDLEARVRKGVKCVATWAGLAFVFHLVWELGHLPFYTLWNDDSGQRIAGYVLHCTVGDVLIATGTFLGTSAVLRCLDWPAHTPWLGGTLMVAAGLAYTVFSEWYNVYELGSWSYAPSMPLFGGIGLTPLLQWLVVPSVMVATTRRFSRHGKGKTRESLFGSFRSRRSTQF